MPRCIVSDLDRTLTGADLRLDAAALERIRALRARDVLFIVATGRRFEDLVAMGLVRELDGVVAENGALVHVPRMNLFEVADAGFVQNARDALDADAAAFTWGRAIASGPRGLAARARERLLAAGVPHELEYNAEEVMILPSGVSKASGAEACLRRLGLSASDAWAIGDGENDAALLRWARVGAAPSNAAPAALEAASVRMVAPYAQAFLDLTAPLVA